MRKLLTSCVLALGLVGTLEIHAGIRPSIFIVGPSEKQFGVRVETDSNELFDIRFINSNGLILHKEAEIANHYAKRFDLSYLEPGTYKLEVENKSQISTFVIEVSDGGIGINSSIVQVVMKPIVKVVGSAISVKMNTLELPYQVKIFDRNERLIYEESHSGSDKINKVYDVSRHGGGNYRVQVVVNSRSFSETVAFGW